MIIMPFIKIFLTHTCTHPALLTVNFQKDPQEELRKLMNVQPDKPMMVMEFWPGWFDHWGYEHLKRDVTATELIERITTILKLGSSFNLYMFHGNYK